MPSHSIRQRVVVVGVDGSTNAAAALQWAARDAAVTGARLIVVSAWHRAGDPTPGRRGGVASGPREEQEAQELVEDLTADLDLPGVQTRHRVGQGPASQVLVAVAGEEAADLLVVGARGQEGSRRVGLGSVSSRCASKAHCPVVVVPADWTASEDGQAALVSSAQPGSSDPR